MSRPIEFRAWYHGDPYPTDIRELSDSEKPQMIFNAHNIYDGHNDRDDPNNVVGWASNMNSLVNDDYYKFTLMQYTGLKDIGNSKIFEGDIVDPGHADGKLIVVTIGEQEHFEDYGGVVVYYGCNLIISSGYPRGVKHNYKIVGNIYENPELSEESE